MTAPTLSRLDRFKAAASDNLAALPDRKLVDAYAMARALHALRKAPTSADALLPMLALGDMIAARFGPDYLDAVMDAVDTAEPLPGLPPRA